MYYPVITAPPPPPDPQENTFIGITAQENSVPADTENVDPKSEEMVSQDRMSTPKIIRRTRGPRTAVPPTLYHEAEIILHCAIICNCFTQSGTSVLLGACSWGGARGPRTNSPPLSRKAGPRTTQTLSSEFDMTW